MIDWENDETYIVDEAKFVSSCFNFPSKAKPRLSLLFARSGVNEYTFVRFEQGVIGNPSLKSKSLIIHRMRRKAKISKAIERHLLSF